MKKDMFRFEELSHACRLLFGEHMEIGQDFVLSLDHSALKKAYRTKALSTHPDRCAALGRQSQAQATARFQDVNLAYQTLSKYLNQRSGNGRPKPIFTAEEVRSWKRSASGRTWTPRAGQQDRRPPWETAQRVRVYAPDKVPNWQVRTGEFLYFAGVVSWNQLISALVWQKQQRLALGEIARRWGWLSEPEVMDLLNDRKRGERLGEILLRHGFISDFQLSMLLRHQEKTQKPLGRFFIQNGLFSEPQLLRYLDDLRHHNQKHGRG